MRRSDHRRGSDWRAGRRGACGSGPERRLPRKGGWVEPSDHPHYSSDWTWQRKTNWSPDGSLEDTPLGTAPGEARFSSIEGDFHTLYAATNLATAIAEAILRDRFEGGGPRLLFSTELEERCVVQLSARVPLDSIDLRTDGCFQLGVSTDIASAKGWNQSRKLARHVYDQTALDSFLYRSRLTGANCIAVFGRAIATKLTAGRARSLTAAPGLEVALKSLSVEVIL